jgi:hypothetical protein
MTKLLKVGSGLILTTAIMSAPGSVLAAPAILKGPLMMTGFYANVLTGLMPHLWAGLDVVSREMVGMIPSVSRNASMERAAVNQDVTYPIAPPMETHDNTPSMATPEPEDHETLPGVVKITKSKNANFGFVGEEQRALSSGVGHQTLQAQFFASALRTLVNEIEADGVAKAYEFASRAWGTPGTVPFSDDKTTAAAQIRKILDDNGAPGGRSMVIDTSSGAAQRSNYNLTKVADAGSAMTLRQGELLEISGMSMKESGALGFKHTKGTENGNYTTSNAGFAKGTRDIPLITGSGTILVGDVVQFAGDPNKYVVETGIGAPGTIRIQQPGLMEAIPAIATQVTVSATHRVSGFGFSSDALVLAARAPAMPEEGDAAVDSFLMVDPRSGLAFDVRVYLGYGKVRYQVGLAWGWGAPNPRHIAMLLG